MKKSIIILKNLYSIWKYRRILMRCSDEVKIHTGEDNGLLTAVAGNDEVYDGIFIAHRLNTVVTMSPKELKKDLNNLDAVIEKFDLKR